MSAIPGARSVHEPDVRDAGRDDRAARVPVGRLGRTSAVPGRAARRLHRPHRSRHREHCSPGSARGPRRRAAPRSEVEGGHRFWRVGAVRRLDRPAVRFRSPDGVAEHLGRGVGRPVVRLADRDRRCGGRRHVPVRARRRQPDRHALGPVAVPGDGSPDDGLDARRRRDGPTGVRSGRDGRRRRGRRRSSPIHPWARSAPA